MILSSTSVLPPSIRSYCAKRGVSAPWRIEPEPEKRYDGAIVIPALAEHRNLPLTLQSLAANPPHLLERFLILAVINQRADASPAELADNQSTIRELAHWKQRFALVNLHWIDAASAGKELPSKQGVGLARKIGMDLALPHLDYGYADPLLICLDADTLVQPDYLQALADHFSGPAAGGACIPFRHQAAASVQGQAAIDRYELFLRVYVLGLELAGSPYAFHTVGSAMACRSSAYAASGGMNRRLAGEDFYFLQQVFKTSGVAPVSGTTVHPSPRSSHRVPFGTGRAVGEMLSDGEERLLFYQPVLFDILKEWLAVVITSDEAGGDDLLAGAEQVTPHLRRYLEQAGFSGAWDNMQRHNPDPQRRMHAFHCWFDAFRTMRLMHHLTDCAWPRIAPEQAVAPLLERKGYGNPGQMRGQLDLLRSVQSA